MLIPFTRNLPFIPIFAQIMGIGFLSSPQKWFSAAIILLFLCSSYPLKKGGYKIKTIVIDAGHGGKDPGCHGKKSKEKDIALNIALELGKQLKSKLKGVKVIFTRDDDTFVELHDRASIANRNHADLFISVHCNAGGKLIYGTETFVMGLHTSEQNLQVAKRENSVILQEDNYLEKYEGFNPKSPLAHIYFSNFQSAHLTNSLRLADKIESHFTGNIGLSSRGVKQAGFLVLWRTAMPAVLVETGYLTHKHDEGYLASESGQKSVAKGIALAVEAYKKEMETDEAE